MTVLFAATSVADLPEVGEATVGAPTNFTDVAETIQFGLGTVFSTLFSVPSQQEIHIAFDWNISTLTNKRTSGLAFALRTRAESAFVAVLNFTMTTGDNMVIRRGGGSSTYVDMATVALTTGTSRFDISGKYGPGGFLIVRRNGTVIATYSGTVTSFNGNGNGFGDARIYPVHGSGAGTSRIGKLIVSTEETVDMRLVQRKPTANASPFEWEGSYEDVNETGWSDVDFVVGLPDTRAAMSRDGVTLEEGERIIAVQHSGRARAPDTENPCILRTFCRTSGGEEAVTDITLAGTSFAPFRSILNNPTLDLTSGAILLEAANG